MRDEDLEYLLLCQEKTHRWNAESERVDALLKLAQRDERAALLISQHDPVAMMGLDREALRIALRFIESGDIARMHRDIAALKASRTNEPKS